MIFKSSASLSFAETIVHIVAWHAICLSANNKQKVIVFAVIKRNQIKNEKSY
jgi:hypothetical protein